MYTLIGKASTRASRVLWMLEELGLEYDWVKVMPHSPEARAANPSGRLPALEVDGEIITDSAAILQFLADRHGEFTFPVGTIERAKQDSILHYLVDEIDGTLWTATRHKFLLPEDKRVPDIAPSLKWEFGRATKVLGQRLGDGPYLMGDTMTIVDIIAVHCLGWAFGAKFPIEDERLLAYSKRIRERPAYVRMSELAKA